MKFEQGVFGVFEYGERGSLRVQYDMYTLKSSPFLHISNYFEGQVKNIGSSLQNRRSNMSVEYNGFIRLTDSFVFM